MDLYAIIKKKLQYKSGFSFSELLVTILILLMVSSVVAAGVPAAARAYFKVIDSANAQMLLSTTITNLRKEYSTAQIPNVSTPSQYISGDTGYNVTLCNLENKGIALLIEGATSPQLLVSEKAATNNLISSYDSIDYEDGFVAIEGLKVKKNGVDLAGPVTYRIRALGG